MFSKFFSILFLLCVASFGVRYSGFFTSEVPAVVALWIGAGVFWAGLSLSSVIQSFLNKKREVKKSSASKSDGTSGTLYVGNLDYTVTEDDVRSLFEQYGPIISVRMMRDRRTDRFRGFGFVEMNYDNALKAIDHVAGKEFLGRKLKVNLANDKRR